MATDFTRFNEKPEVLEYFRNRGEEIVTELEKEIGRSNYQKMAGAFQTHLKESRSLLMHAVIQSAEREKWPKEKLVRTALMVSHVANAVMIDFRNQIWPYDYMSFSRRVGELWEGFCSLCFHYTLRQDLVLDVPPLFSDIRKKLDQSLVSYIESLPLDSSQKKELLAYYKKVWLLVDAGEIQLQLDMHATVAGVHYNIDFKSGFGSNEKGNTNRLLLVASIYKHIIDEAYTNLILVRSLEEEGNNYLQILKRSGLWEVFCGAEAYKKIQELTGVALADWIKANIDWNTDLSPETVRHLTENNLIKYLTW